MDKLLIIGDSYSDPKYIWEEKPWHTMLPFEVENISECGVGPRWQLEHLFGRSGKYLLFLLADHNRLHLPCVENFDNTTAVEALNVYQETVNDHPIKNQIVSVHDAFHETGIKDIQADLYCQYIGTQKFERILIWPCADLIHPARLNLTIGSHVVNKPLCDITTLTNHSNHMSEDNHKIFAELITKYFEFGLIPDPSEMNIMLSSDKFIYDN